MSNIIISEEIDFSNRRIDIPKAPAGFHEMPDKLYTYGKFENIMSRVIIGQLDKNGFPYFEVVLENPNSGEIARVRAIVDTGAAPCLVQQHVIDHLKLSNGIPTSILHPQRGTLPSTDYLVNIYMDIDNPQGAARLRNIRVGYWILTPIPPK